MFKKIVPYFLFFTFLISCSRNNKDYAEYANENDILLKYKSTNYTKVQIDNASNLGLINFEDKDCLFEVHVKPKQDLNFTFSNYSGNEVEVLQSCVSELYQILGDPTFPQKENFDYNTIPIDSLINLVKIGILSPQCEGISKISERIIEEKFINKFDVNVIRIETVAHTLNSVSFKENEKTFVTFFDAQNGFFFPSKCKDSLSLYEINELSEIQIKPKDFYFYWLPEEILNKKRNLLDDILPCNMLPQLGSNYYEVQKGSPYKYELLGPSFHKVLWFDLKQVNELKLKEELLNKLVSTNFNDSSKKDMPENY